MSKLEINPASITENNIDKTKEIVIKMFDSKKELTDIEEQEKTIPIDEAANTWKTNDRITNLFANKIEKDTDLKGKYAIILIGILIFQLVVLNILFILKGCEVLKFSDTTFNIFITGGIAEIFVLVRTIVKYLFSDDLSELLKIILKANNYKFKDNKENKNKTEKN